MPQTSFKRVADIIGEIGNAAGEQGSGIGAAGAAVSPLDSTARHNAAPVEQAAAASSLQEQASRLSADHRHAASARRLTCNVGAGVTPARATSN